jgi:glycosyltransferase 2 family protein
LPGQQLIGALVMFRLAYFLVPLCIGSLLFALTELLLRARDRGRQAEGADQPG